MRQRKTLSERSEETPPEDSDLAGYQEAERLLREGIDIITGGFPCQDISSSGEKTGILYDESTSEARNRSGLWGEMCRAVRLVRPRVAIVENVAALLNRGMGTVLGDLASIGYDTEWHCIQAADVGAPHKRDRVFIVANSTGERQSEQGQCIKSIQQEAGAYREANRFVDAFQRGSLPFVCGGHDGSPEALDEDGRSQGECDDWTRELGGSSNS